MQQQRMRRKIPKKNPQHSTDRNEQQIFAGNFTIEIRGLNSEELTRLFELRPNSQAIGSSGERARGAGCGFLILCGPLFQHWALFDGPNIIGL